MNIYLEIQGSAIVERSEHWAAQEGVETVRRMRKAVMVCGETTVYVVVLRGESRAGKRARIEHAALIALQAAGLSTGAARYAEGW
jgi:hypothetical protein